MLSLKSVSMSLHKGVNRNWKWEEDEEKVWINSKLKFYLNKKTYIHIFTFQLNLISEKNKELGIRVLGRGNFR